MTNKERKQFIDRYIKEFEQEIEAQKNAPPQPDPEMVKAQQEAQLEQQKAQQELALMNEIKQKASEVGELVGKLRNVGTTIDQRWVSIGATDLQTGMMALTRAVAQPTTF